MFALRPFFFTHSPPTETYTLSLHDALPIWMTLPISVARRDSRFGVSPTSCTRSEEHTSELQSHHDLVCRLLLEKKKTVRARVEPSSRLFAILSQSRVSRRV